MNTTDDVDMSTPTVEFKVAPPSGKTPSKVLLWGIEGIGKTTLASQFPNPIFIDLERSTVKLKPQPACVPHCSTFDEVRTQLNMLLNTSHKFETLVIDSVDWLESMINDYVKGITGDQSIEDVGGGFAKGYKKTGERLEQFLAGLDTLILKRNMNIVLVGHAAIEKMTEPGTGVSYDRYEVNLNRKHVAPVVKAWVDAMLFCNYRTIIVEASKGEKTHAIGGTERLIYCNHTAAIDAKNRFGLSDTVPLKIESLKPIFE